MKSYFDKIEASINESNENQRKAFHNIGTESDNVKPYSNTALLDLISEINKQSPKN